MAFARFMLALLFALAIVALGQSGARAARLALVIGNDGYAEIPALAKARNDAMAMGARLESLGFDATVVTDADRRGMNRAIQEFADSVAEGDTALFFFAGHGVEIAGKNYLLPVDTPKGQGDDGEFIAAEAIGVDDLLERLRARSPQLHIVILDACRDNPFSRSGTRGFGGQAGLARISAPQGAFVMYSADVGEAALDSLGAADNDPNSVFTRTLLPLLADPAFDLVDTAREVRRRVRDLAAGVRHRQTPAYYDAVLGEFRFAALSPDAGPGADPADPVAPQGAPRATPPAAPEAKGAPLAPAMIATGGEKDSVRVWDAATGAMLAKLAGEKIVLSTIAFSADGKALHVAGADGALFSYSLPDFKKVRAVYPGFRATALVETADGLLAGGADGTVALLSVRDWSPVWSRRLHEGIVSPLFVDGDRALSASEDGAVLRFALADGEILSRIETGRPVTDVAGLASGSIVAVHEDGMATVIDPASGSIGATFRANKGWVSAVVRVGRGSGFATAGVDGELAFWSDGAPTPLFTVSGHADVASSVRMLAVEGTERVVTTGFDGAVKLWSKAGELVRGMDHGSAILHAAHFPVSAGL